MISLTPQTNDGMGAGVCMYDGDYLAWFGLERGLRQGCVLSLMQINNVSTSAQVAPPTGEQVMRITVVGQEYASINVFV